MNFLPSDSAEATVPSNEVVNQATTVAEVGSVVQSNAVVNQTAEADPVQQLLALGFSEADCRLAMSFNVATTEERVNLILANNSESEDDGIEDHKMVMIVRTDLEMSAGKVAAQCVHAALGAVRESNPDTVALWTSIGEAVVTLRCDNFDKMMALHKKAKDNGLVAHAMMDAGRTEVEPGTVTVVAIGPDTCSRVNSITKRLRLY